MRVRKLTDSDDMTFGRSQNNFWFNVPDGVAQVVLSRLEMYTGDWFLDLDDGTPWRTQVLGKYTGSTRDAAVQARILGTPGVQGITAFSSQVNRDTRQYTVQATVETIYGTATLDLTL